jgi:hypothetical protein
MMKGKVSWVAFGERPLGSDPAGGTGRKVCVRAKDVIMAIGDGRGSVLYLRNEPDPIAVVEEITVVMERLEP